MTSKRTAGWVTHEEQVSVVCPKCGAVPGENCRRDESRTERKGQSHIERRKAATKARWRT